MIHIHIRAWQMARASMTEGDVRSCKPAQASENKISVLLGIRFGTRRSQFKFHTGRIVSYGGSLLLEALSVSAAAG